MKSTKKIFLFLGKFLLWVFVGINLFIVFSGNFYIYKAVWNTYLKGRGGPSIEEYQIFYNRRVDVGEPKEWPTGNNYNIGKISDELRANIESMKTASYLVIKNDSIRYEEYWDNFSDSSHTNSFSMAKTIVSILVGCAIDDGKIKSLDEAVGNYLEEYKNGENSKLTIRHLVTMSSAIDWDENYINPLAYPARGYYGKDLRKLNSKYKVAGESGKIFEYRSGNTQMLGFILEKATGKSLAEYASDKLWKPMGAKFPAYWSLDDENGNEKAFCCFNSNARDFARIGQLFLDSGRWNGKQIISEKYVLESIQLAPLFEDDATQNKRYGYSWWIIPDYKGHYVFYARGILGQYIFVIPEKKMVVVRLGKKRELQQGKLHPKDVYYYLDAAFKVCAE